MCVAADAEARPLSEHMYVDARPTLVPSTGDSRVPTAQSLSVKWATSCSTLEAVSLVMGRGDNANPTPSSAVLSSGVPNLVVLTLVRSCLLHSRSPNHASRFTRW